MADVQIQEPNDLPSQGIDDSLAAQIAVLVYSKEREAGGIKKLGLLEWKKYLDYDHNRVKQLAEVLGIPTDEYDPKNEFNAPTITLSDKVAYLMSQLNIDEGLTQPDIPWHSQIGSLKYDMYTDKVYGNEEGVKKGLAKAKEDIDRLTGTVSGGSDGGPSLTSQVGELQSKTGDLERTVYGDKDDDDDSGGGTKGLVDKVSALEDTTGSLSTDVKKLQDEVEGDGGLLEEFSEAQSKLSELEEKVGEHGTKLSDLESDVEKLQEEIEGDGGLMQKFGDEQARVSELESKVNSLEGSKGTWSAAKSEQPTVYLSTLLKEGVWQVTSKVDEGGIKYGTFAFEAASKKVYPAGGSEVADFFSGENNPQCKDGTEAMYFLRLDVPEGDD